MNNLEEQLLEMSRIADKLQDRINKAIKLIESKVECIGEKYLLHDFTKEEVIKLYNTLQGSDKE